MEAKQVRRIGLALVLLLVVPCVVVCAQFSIQLPGSVQPGTYTGNSIDFGDVEVGTTKTVTYRFGVTSTSSTAGSLTFIGFQGGFFRKPPFALTNLPSLPKNITPGGSITFNVTFTPTTVRTYTDQFTITVSGGWPMRTKQHTVTLTGRGVAQDWQQDGSGTQTYPQYDFTRLQTTINTTRQEVARLETKLDMAQQDIARLEAKLDRLPGQLPEINASRLEAKLDGLDAELAEWYEMLLDYIEDVWAMLRGLEKSELTDIETSIDKLETKLDKLEPTLDDIEMDLSMLVDGVRDLDSGSAQTISTPYRSI